MPTDELWNLETALESVDGYVDDLKDLLEIWLQQTPEHLQTLRDSIAAADSQGVHRIAHTMCSSMDILGAARLSEITRDLQTLGDADMQTRGAALFREMQQLINALIPELAAFRNSPGPSR